MTVEEFIEQIANQENKDNTLNCSQYEIIFQNNRDDKIIEEYENVNIETVIIEHDKKRIFLI